MHSTEAIEAIESSITMDAVQAGHTHSADTVESSVENADISQ